MVKYYTRACNFYFGQKSKRKISEGKALPLNNNHLISFDTIELNSSEVGPLDSKSLRFDPSQANIAMANVAASLELYAMGSSKRIAALLQLDNDHELTTPFENDYGVSLMKKTAELLVSELWTANAALDKIKSPKKEASEAAKKAK